MIIFQVLIFLILCSGFYCRSCLPQTFGDGKIVCVCDETYCDDLVLLSDVAQNQAAVYETNKNGKRWDTSVANFSSTTHAKLPVLSINRSEIFQFILGFGGAFTDAAGINIKSVSNELQKRIMTSYFSDTGLQYNMGRIPIASCDFSTHPYSYCDFPGDFNLSHFKLAEEDLLYKIPLIQLASQLSQEKLLLFGSPWSAPAWMKTNNAMNGKGELKGKAGQFYYKTWADYLVRFLENYQQNNISLWGLTLQNEPTDGCIANFTFQAMCFPPEKQRDFIKLDLGPALEKARFTADRLQLMIVDDDRMMLPRWVDVIMSDPDVSKFVSGIAFHWYYEQYNPQKLLDVTHNKYPGLFLLSSEACTGYLPWEFPKCDLGSWDRAERYAHDIIMDLLHWTIGWIDWNLVLDMQGGPNWVSNFVDAPIIVNVGKNQFYKQPMYYALAHFSKCLPRGSYRIGLKVPDSFSALGSTFSIAAFQTPKDKIVVIALNRSNKTVEFAFHDLSRGYLNVSISSHSLKSFMW